MVQIFPRLEFRQGSWRSITGFVVPWANILADIATKDMVAYGPTELFRNHASFFNRQIGDAKAGIKFAGGDDGLRGAGVNTATATATAVSGRSFRRKL